MENTVSLSVSFWLIRSNKRTEKVKITLLRDLGFWYISLWMIGQRPSLIAFFSCSVSIYFWKAKAHTLLFLWWMVPQKRFSSRKARGAVINDAAWSPTGATEDDTVVWKQLLLWGDRGLRAGGRTHRLTPWTCQDGIVSNEGWVRRERREYVRRRKG